MNTTWLKKIATNIRDEYVLSAVAVILASLVAWQAHALGVIKLLVDQNSHLNISRQVVDSMTPGISQLGYWPPFLHVLMIPAVSIEPLYRNGMAGFATLLPFLVIATVYLYKTCRLLTGNRLISIWCTTLFILNPFVLYYTATPMMEILFMAFLFMTAYYMALWLKTGRLSTLLTAGITVTLATVSRFEGLFLIPITFGIVLLKLWKNRSTLRQTEALLLLFGFLALSGFAAIMLYGFLFGGNPFAFMNSAWSAFNQQRDYFLPTERDFLTSFKYFAHASYHVQSTPLVFLAFITFPLLLLLRPSAGVIAACVIFFSPFLFDYTALVRGNAIIYVPELPPYGTFFNERYGLYWIGFSVFVPALFFMTLLRKSVKLQAFHIPMVTLIAAVLTGSVIYSAYNLYSTGFVHNFSMVKQSAQGYPSKEQIELAVALRDNYDFGKVLMTRALHDFVAVNANVPLRDYIHESNFKFYDQALERPWLFTRWVVMFNPVEGNEHDWAQRNEKVSRRWGGSDEFHHYYTLVMDNSRERLYKVKDDAVIEYAKAKGYTPARIPSLNADIRWWDPETAYASLQLPMDEHEARAVIPTTLMVKAQLQDYYETNLRPEYTKGVVITPDGSGSSESQSYALLQSFWADDRDTFDAVWKWTREHITRKDDRLFSWKFSVDKETGKTTIIDKNSATDADTDIAHALILAGEAWAKPEYVEEAKKIIADIWEYETITLNDKRIVTAGNWADTTREIVTNPSYFSPAAYRLFAKYDTEHNWDKLINDGYPLIDQASTEAKREHNVFLPPNWIAVQKKDGSLASFRDNQTSADYSYDAFRTHWRVGLDEKLHPNNTALVYLQKTDVFASDWKSRQEVCSLYPAADQCSYNQTTASGPLSVLTATEPNLADQYVQKYYLSSDDLKDAGNWSFYEKSWYWFGLSLYSGYFDNEKLADTTGSR